MIRLVFFFYLVLYSGYLILAQNKPGTLLWEVRKKGNAHVSYLFGTFHEVTPSFFNSLTNVVTHLNNSEVLFIEEKKSKSIKSSDSSSLPKWNSLQWKTILTPDQNLVFRNFIDKAEDTSYYSLSPLLLTLMVSRQYMMNFCEVDHNSDQLMDWYIEDTANKQNKKIMSLDENQKNIISRASKTSNSFHDSLYAGYSIIFMKSMLNEDLTQCEIIENYKKFNFNYELDSTLDPSNPSFNLLKDRNKKWVKVLKKAFTKNNCFVAVGIRHLFYKEGLIVIMRNLGYSVTPVPIVI